MKYFVLVLCALALVLSPEVTLAKKGGNSSGNKGKGPHPSASAYEHASDKAKFKREDDWRGGKDKYEEEIIELDEDGKKIKKKKKRKKGEVEESVEISEDGEKSRKKIKVEGDKTRVREEHRTKEKIREREREEDDEYDDGRKRSGKIEKMRERVLHRNSEKQ